jgi:hypothetical protein
MMLNLCDNSEFQSHMDDIFMTVIWFVCFLGSLLVG